MSKLSDGVLPIRHFLFTSFFCLMMCVFALSCVLAGGVLNVNVGQTFDIELGTNPSTGYAWNPVFQSEYLALKSRKIDHGTGTVKPIGAPVKERFTFIAVKPGFCEIEFQYSRSWENVSVKTESFTVNISR